MSVFDVESLADSGLPQGERVARMLMPWPLAKAIYDEPWIYACGLKDGTVIFFSGADWTEGEPFVTLSFDEIVIPEGYLKVMGTGAGTFMDFDLGRGLAVRLDQIMWALDAPFGS